jgi:hypothetical protein
VRWKDTENLTLCLACVGNEVWETADVFVVSRLQPIAPDHPPRRASRHDPSRTEETAARVMEEIWHPKGVWATFIRRSAD